LEGERGGGGGEFEYGLRSRTKKNNKKRSSDKEKKRGGWSENRLLKMGNGEKRITVVGKKGGGSGVSGVAGRGVVWVVGG